MYVIVFVQFMGYRAKDMSVLGFICCVEQYYSIIIEMDVGVIMVVDFFFGVNNNCFRNCIFFDIVVWCGFFYGDYDLVIN